MTHPPPPMDHQAVLALARLAHLDLSADETARVCSHLRDILTYIAQLQELDLSTVPPTANVQIEQSSLRSDEERSGLSHALALGQAPLIVEDGFAVPPFVDEG